MDVSAIDKYSLLMNDFINKKNIKNLTFNGKNYNSNIFDWARETFWFGRRLAKYKTVLV